MASCDCLYPYPMKTRQDIICGDCGVVLDKIYENDMAFEKVAHLTNPMLQDIHPSINQTLSTLSQHINMKTETRIEIIDRANQIVGSGINYIEATQISFLEIFPNVNIGLMPKKEKQIKQRIKENGKNGPKNPKKHSKTNKRINQIEKMNTLIKKGKKKDQTIIQIMKRARFSSSTYYRNKKLKLLQKPKLNYYLPGKGAKITHDIHEFIFNNLDKPLNQLRMEIKWDYGQLMDTSTIWYHIKNNKKINGI